MTPSCFSLPRYSNAGCLQALLSVSNIGRLKKEGPLFYKQLKERAALDKLFLNPDKPESIALLNKLLMVGLHTCLLLSFLSLPFSHNDMCFAQQYFPMHGAMPTKAQAVMTQRVDCICCTCYTMTLLHLVTILDTMIITYSANHRLGRLGLQAVPTSDSASLQHAALVTLLANGPVLQLWRPGSCICCPASAFACELHDWLSVTQVMCRSWATVRQRTRSVGGVPRTTRHCCGPTGSEAATCQAPEGPHHRCRPLLTGSLNTPQHADTS